METARGFEYHFTPPKVHVPDVNRVNTNANSRELLYPWEVSGTADAAVDARECSSEPRTKAEIVTALGAVVTVEPDGSESMRAA